MTDCLQAGYSIGTQTVIPIFFLYLWYARFFSAWQSGLSISWPVNQRGTMGTRYTQFMIMTHNVLLVVECGYLKKLAAPIRPLLWVSNSQCYRRDGLRLALTLHTIISL